jgi:hypothetical protein
MVAISRMIAARAAGSGAGICAGGGSGWVAVGPIERGGHSGSNGGSYSVVVAILIELRSFVIFFLKKT